MELNIARQTIEVEKLIGQAAMQTQVTAETAVPGAGREAILVLMEESALSVDSSEAQTDRVVVDGTITCQAVYRQGENAAVRAVVAKTRLSETLELSGVTPRSIIRVRAEVEAVSADYENGRMRFFVTVNLSVQAMALQPFEAIVSTTEDERLCRRFRELCSDKLAAEAVADALLTEEVALPAQLDARVALMDWSSAHISTLEPDLGGVRATGEVQAEALIGTGVPTRPVALVKVMLPFDQLVQLPEWLTSRACAEVTVTRLFTAVEPGGEENDATLKIEAEVRVSVEADARDCVNALCDAYGTDGVALKTDERVLTLCVGKEAVDCQEPFRGTLLLPDGAPGVGTVLATRVKPVVSQWRNEDGETVLEGALDIKALYLPGGAEEIAAARGELPFALRCRGAWPEDAWVRVETVSAEAAALMSDRLEIKCGLRALGTYRVRETVRVAENMEEAEAKPRDVGLVIVWPDESDTAWSVGKRYALREAQVGDVSPGKPVVLRV